MIVLLISAWARSRSQRLGWLLLVGLVVGILELWSDWLHVVHLHLRGSRHHALGLILVLRSRLNAWAARETAQALSVSDDNFHLQFNTLR
ncbi:MAG: hypothetical protein ACREMQ_22105 [Longimicrobiales bacterium]